MRSSDSSGSRPIVYEFQEVVRWNCQHVSNLDVRAAVIELASGKHVAEAQLCVSTNGPLEHCCCWWTGAMAPLISCGHSAFSALAQNHTQHTHIANDDRRAIRCRYHKH
jgi:hypothetical protein